MLSFGLLKRPTPITPAPKAKPARITFKEFVLKLMKRSEG